MLADHRIYLSFFLMLLLACSPINAQNQTRGGATIPLKDPNPMYMTNPATWINDCYNRLNELYLFQSQTNIDTSSMYDRFKEHQVVISILKKEFYGNSENLNIRSVYNMKMRVADILDDIISWQKKIHILNETLVKKTHDIELIKHEIHNFRKQDDSVFILSFADAITALYTRQQNGEKLILADLKRNTAIENRIVDINTEVYLFLSDITSMLKSKEVSLIKRELPPVWQSPPSIYPSGIVEVLQKSFLQTLETIKYYGESSIWRIIIFRVMVFLLCLIPIGIFNNENRKSKIMESTDLVFLAKYPKTASAVMGMAMSPFIFVHPPHAFLEFIFIGLTFTVTMMTLKRYPQINKTVLLTLVVSFMVLYLINFFVTPTFLGRFVYSASILLLIPLYKAYKQAPDYNLVNYKLVRIFFLFLACHLIAGWGFVIWGNYTLGRSFILSAYSLLVLSMILRIAIYTMLDYLEIISYFFNKEMKSAKINFPFVYHKAKPMLIVFAVTFSVVAYIYNLNMFDLFKSGFVSFLGTTRTIGSTEFTFMNILLFFGAVYIAFLLANLIRYFFEPQLDYNAQKRSKMGSYLLLLRLLIIVIGFTIGIMASGMPLTQFTLLLGAMGVGIGFGLQNIVSNLVSGVIIAFERPFVVGDVLDFGNETCKVKEISLRATMVSTSEGADILIPNNSLLSERLKNWTISNKQRFLEIKVQTVLGSDPTVVMQLISKILDGQEELIRERCKIYLAEINDEGFVFSIKILIDDLSNGSKLRSELLLKIQEAFTKNGIRFPQSSNLSN